MTSNEDLEQDGKLQENLQETTSTLLDCFQWNIILDAIGSWIVFENSRGEQKKCFRRRYAAFYN